MDDNIPLEGTIERVREVFPLVRWLDNEFVSFGDGFLYGATFWSHIDPNISEIIEAYMHDYKKIFTSTSRTIDSIDTSLINIECGAKLIDWAAHHPKEKLTVLTHHAPSFRSAVFPDDVTTNAFCNHLDRFLEDNRNISCWLHGHVHSQQSYLIGSAKVICNPHGYYKEKAKAPFYRPRNVVS